jgi:hypothetical protein
MAIRHMSLIVFAVITGILVRERRKRTSKVSGNRNKGLILPAFSSRTSVSRLHGLLPNTPPFALRQAQGERWCVEIM